MNQGSNCKPALISSARFFNSEVIGELRAGWHGRSLGARVVNTEDGSQGWLRVQYYPFRHRNSHQATGEAAARSLDTVIRKPALRDQVEWQEGPLVWRADLLDFIPDDTISRTPELRTFKALPDRWWKELSQTLSALAEAPTDRFAFRQDAITRRIENAFGKKAPSKVTQWETAHGDLSWENLTGPNLHLLDWEAWGMAPAGFDAAYLLCLSGLEPDIACKVRQVFREKLLGPDGRVAVLLACAELLRVIEVYDDHRDLKPWLQNLSFEALTGLQVLG